jgi:integrase
MPEKRITVWVQRFRDRANLVLQWLDPDSSKRKSRTTGANDEKQAEKARADLEYELNHGRYQEASRMSWERFRELFEDEYVANLRLHTRINYSDTFNLFEELCSPVRLRSINERMISAFVGAMRQRPTRGRIGMQSSTIRVRLEFMHTALAWAVQQKLLPIFPKFPDIRVPKKKPQPVPAETFERLFEKAADEQTRAFLLTGWLGGLRLREALSLEWEANDKAPWIDLSRNRLILPAEFAKSDEDQWVPLDPVLREAIERLPRHGPRVFRFISRKTGEPICAEGMSQRIIKLAKKAGVKLSMHTLRKGFGCRYAGKVPAQVLQRLMRHSNIKTTMDYYANIDDAVEEAVLGAKRNTSRNTKSDACQRVQDANSISDNRT